jgi:hypothetical protein
MKDENIDLTLENQSLKNEFVIRNLDPEQVFFPSPDDLAWENRRLQSLLDWVDKYSVLQSRKKMEADGYLYPPVEPDLSPDNDWFVFKRWIKGHRVRLSGLEQLATPYTPKDPEQLSDKELLSELDHLYDLLDKSQFCVDFQEGIPPRLVYENLIEMLKENFEIMTGGFWVLSACTGYCPDCFQRPWCELGTASCWSEDKKIGEMFLHDSVRRFVSASPVSLALLKKCQEKKDREMQEWEKSLNGDEVDQPNDPIADDDINELPF